MTIPVWVLLMFAMWTLVTLFGSVGVYRWSRILTGRVPISEWRADEQQGAEWYRRAMRAHANCIENLPVYGAVVVAIIAAGADAPLLDAAAVILILSRVGQTMIHIVSTPTNLTASLRFAFFAVQAMCMITMAAYLAM